MKIFIIILCVIFLGVSGPGLSMLSADMAYPPRKLQEEKKKVEKKTEKKEEKKVEKKEGKKEDKKEKKKEKKKEVQKVWTNDDLKKVQDVNITIVEADPKTKAATSTGAAATGNKRYRTQKPRSKPTKKKIDKKTTQKYWQDRKNSILKKIVDTEAKIKALEARAAQLQYKYLNNDLLFSERRQTEAEYNKALTSLKNYKSGLVKLKQSLEDLRTEARRAGIPPGWVR